MIRDEMIGLAKQIAAKHGLDSALVCALVHQESAWRPWAARYEPIFFGRYIATMQGLSPTEMQGRAFSYGLTQLMGQVAREFGFAGDYLSELFDPIVNLEFGCRKLARCMDRANQDRRTALLSYNGGGAPNYPDLVLRYLTRYQT